ncbi:MAG: hypothetical protein HYX73_09900 [Acidobacteria bacterium]|nr:hypothetical protein [Acidobacteriota bacterium]
MKLEHLDELDELLRTIDRSGLCRADRRVSAGRKPQRIAVQISANQERLLEVLLLGQPAQVRKLLLPGH